MALAFDLTQFPDRPNCFQPDTIPINASCSAPSFSMLQFLNISTPGSYFQHYCLNPPNDSCAFGFCPNSDIAGLAVRIASKSFRTLTRGTTHPRLTSNAPSIRHYDLSVDYRAVFPGEYGRRVLWSITPDLLAPHRGRHRDCLARAQSIACEFRPLRRLLASFHLHRNPCLRPDRIAKRHASEACFWL